MAITVRELVTKLGFTTDVKKLDEFNNKISLTKKRLEDVAQKSTQIGRRLTIGLTLPIAGLSAFAIKAASDAEEIRSKFGTVFQDLREESDQTARQLSRDFGLSGTKARELLGNTGDLLTGFGFTQESALDLSKQVNELAVDLASFTNFSGGAEGASAALTKALLGERESVKSLGISILEEDVKKQIAINSAKGLTFETERQAKAFATLQLAQQQSKNAIGDFARTSTSFANRLRIFRARLQDVAEGFGNIILPPATALLNRVIKLLEAFNDLSDGTKKFILIMGGLAAIVGPLFLMFGFFAGALVKIVAAYQLVTKAVLAFRAAMISANIAAFAIPAAIAAAVVAVVLIVEDLIAFFQGRKSVTGIIIQKFQEMVPKVVQSFKDMFASVISLFNGIKNVIASIFSFFIKTVKENISLIKDTFGILKDIMIAPFLAVKDSIMSVFSLIDSILKSKLFSALVSAPTELLNNASGALEKLSKGKTFSFIGKIGDKFKSRDVQGIQDRVKGNVEPIVQKVVQIAEDSTPSVNRVAETVFRQAPLVNGLQNAQSNIVESAVQPSIGNAASQSQVFNIKLDAPINVDQKTTPDDIGVTIQQGLESGLERVLRQTARANAPALEF